MPFRSFGAQSVTTSTPQPVFGVASTAAFAPIPDPRASSPGIQPGTNPPPTTIAVAKINNRVPFSVGDPVLVGPAGGPYESAFVLAVSQAGATISVSGLTKAHASGDLVILNIDCADVAIQAMDGGTHAMYVGLTNTVSATDYSTIAEIWAPPTTGQLPEFRASFAPVGNFFKSGDFWIVGTSSEKFLARLFQI